MQFCNTQSYALANASLLISLQPFFCTFADVLFVQVHHSGPAGDVHPMDKKVQCRVYLRDLQRSADLTDAALQHIALICGPR